MKYSIILSLVVAALSCSAQKQHETEDQAVERAESLATQYKAAAAGAIFDSLFHAATDPAKKIKFAYHAALNYYAGNRSDPRVERLALYVMQDSSGQVCDHPSYIRFNTSLNYPCSVAFLLGEYYDLQRQFDRSIEYYKKFLYTYPPYLSKYRSSEKISYSSRGFDCLLKGTYPEMVVMDALGYIDEIHSRLANVCFEKKDSAAALGWLIPVASKDRRSGNNWCWSALSLVDVLKKAGWVKEFNSAMQQFIRNPVRAEEGYLFTFRKRKYLITDYIDRKVTIADIQHAPIQEKLTALLNPGKSSAPAP